MINHLQLIRNVGRFDSVTTAANVALAPLTLIYAENGRGKTTLAAILRSLATGDSIPIVERRRLAAQHPPHVIISCSGGPPAATFQNGVWNRNLANMVVFDDVFIDQNVYSGLIVGSDHRQKLHELILGAQGVSLNRDLQLLIEQVEEHNRTLRQRESAIPAAERDGLTVDKFCALPSNGTVALEIAAVERDLAAAREQNHVSTTPSFELIRLPSFDLDGVESILQSSIEELDTTAVHRVQAQLETSGENAEAWVSEGMRRQAARPEHVAGECVFCAQNLNGSPVIGHYRAFFSDSYRALTRSVSTSISTLTQEHSDGVATGLERAVRAIEDRRQFWSRFAELPQIQIDTTKIIQDWHEARDLLIALLTTKQADPLDAVSLSYGIREAVQRHRTNLAEIAATNLTLTQVNGVIAEVKQRAASANPTTLSATLSRLKATQARHSAEISPLCADYLTEKQSKAATERLRDQAKAALEQYRDTVFPRYQAAINRYLSRFNAGFQLDSVTAVNTRGGPTCTYNVVINETPVSIAGGTPQPGDHSFKNTLSAGDRNTLALAFFFASIELDPNLSTKTVVIDDPVSSLDDHRSLSTVQEIRSLALRVSQVIVLSHSKPFLCRIWEGSDRTRRAAMHVVRNGNGSTIETWNVDNDSFTEHDRRDGVLRTYLASRTGNDREVARSLRPHVEAFMRVACPEHFPPGTLLGPFRGICDQRVNTQNQILNTADIQELRSIVEYANRFHHDTNAAWETEVINDAELTGFAGRVLTFVKRP